MYYLQLLSYGSTKGCIAPGWDKALTYQKVYVTLSTFLYRLTKNGKITKISTQTIFPGKGKISASRMSRVKIAGHQSTWKNFRSAEKNKSWTQVNFLYFGQKTIFKPIRERKYANTSHVTDQNMCHIYSFWRIICGNLAQNDSILHNNIASQYFLSKYTMNLTTNKGRPTIMNWSSGWWDCLHEMMTLWTIILMMKVKVNHYYLRT